VHDVGYGVVVLIWFVFVDELCVFGEMVCI